MRKPHPTENPSPKPKTITNTHINHLNSAPPSIRHLFAKQSINCITSKSINLIYFSTCKQHMSFSPSRAENRTPKGHTRSILTRVLHFIILELPISSLSDRPTTPKSKGEIPRSPLTTIKGYLLSRGFIFEGFPGKKGRRVSRAPSAMFLTN